MPAVLVIDDDRGALGLYATILGTAGYEVLTAPSGYQGLDVLRRHQVDLVVSDLRLPDISGLDVLQRLRAARAMVPFVVVSGFGSARDAVTALRLGAIDFLEKPVLADDLLRIVEKAVAPASAAAAVEQIVPAAVHREAHAAARWARAVVAVVDAPRDPRTIAAWSQLVAASPGALRSWCRMTGASARRSLVFARLLRAVSSPQGGRHSLANLLDVADERTLLGLVRLAGFRNEADVPADVGRFLETQVLMRDGDTLREVRRALDERHRRRRGDARLGPHLLVQRG